MRPTQPDVKPTIHFDVHQFELSAAEEEMLRGDLEAMRDQVENFPVADFKVLIEGNARTSDTNVKITLVLPGTTLVAGDHDAVMHAAFERAMDRLRDSLEAYKERLGYVHTRTKVEQGTQHARHPTMDVEPERIEAAVAEGDYAAFRAAMAPYEEEIRKAAGRWVQRYPELDGQIDNTVKLADIVEDVFLLAFEGYAERPANVALSDWLQAQIDTAIKALLHHRDEELENIDFVRSAAEIAAARTAAEREEHAP